MKHTIYNSLTFSLSELTKEEFLLTISFQVWVERWWREVKIFPRDFDWFDFTLLEENREKWKEDGVENELLRLGCKRDNLKNISYQNNMSEQFQFTTFRTTQTNPVLVSMKMPKALPPTWKKN